jgi:hypothetical protein
VTLLLLLLRALFIPFHTHALGCILGIDLDCLRKTTGFTPATTYWTYEEVQLPQNLNATIPLPVHAFSASPPEMRLL